jgi:hypothetical protein
MKTSDLLIGAVFLGGIVHLMIFMNGYWNDGMWMSVILNVGVPIAIYKYLKTDKKKRVTKLSAREL